MSLLTLCHMRLVEIWERRAFLDFVSVRIKVEDGTMIPRPKSWRDLYAEEEVSSVPTVNTRIYILILLSLQEKQAVSHPLILGREVVQH